LRLIGKLPPTGQRVRSVVTIGAFDGIHIGHGRILDEVVMLAGGLGVRSVVVTFDPHPISVLQPGEVPCLLTTVDEKVGLVEDRGIDDLVLLKFSPKLARRSAEWFVRNVLLKRLNMRRLVIGYDFRFGRDREGDASYLETLGEAAGFGVDIVPPVNYLSHPVSSTRVRTALVRGDIRSASRMLGRSYSLAGHVVKGEGRGVTLGYPTANLELDDAKKMVPANGVYAVTARFGRREVPAVLYIGTKPTFGGRERTVEVHVLGRKSALYGRHIEMTLHRRLRGDRHFKTVDSLKKAIENDIRRARRILSI
jgi:riboflavin kinase/FMN adenylyltransferase